MELGRRTAPKGVRAGHSEERHGGGQGVPAPHDAHWEMRKGQELKRCSSGIWWVWSLPVGNVHFLRESGEVRLHWDFLW